MSKPKIINGIKWDEKKLDTIVTNNNLIKNLTPENYILPLAGEKIKFSDDIWDFSSNNILNRSKGDMIYRFDDIHYKYKNYIKQIVLEYMLIDELAPSTISNTLRRLKVIIKFLADNLILEPRLITLQKVKEFFNSLNIDLEHRKVNYKNTFIDLLKNIEKYGVSNYFYKEIYEYLSIRNVNLLKAEKEAAKTPGIPKDVFNKIIKYAVKDITNKKVSRTQKKNACIVLLLSQIGMRIGELRLLEAGKKKKMVIFDETPVYYLEFKTYKTIKEKKYKWTTTFLTDLALLAYNTLEKITIEERKHKNTSFLLASYRENKVNPYSANYIRHRMLKFCAKYAIEIGCLNKTEKELPGFNFKKVMKCKKHNYLPKKSLKGFNDEDIIARPNPHQFRVQICTNLYEQGVHIDWIRKHMNHLSYEMTLHYIREREEHEQMRMSEKVLKELINKEVKLIGFNSEVIEEKIDKFIQESNFNIKEDLDKIISEVKDNFPVREKVFGFCIKSAFGRKCSYEEADYEFHFINYEFIDITYRRFKDKVKLIKTNEKNGFVVQADREKKRLKQFISEYLLPEFRELENEIKEKGIECIKNKKTELNDIIKRKNEIKEEINKWI